MRDAARARRNARSSNKAGSGAVRNSSSGYAPAATYSEPSSPSQSGLAGVDTRSGVSQLRIGSAMNHHVPVGRSKAVVMSRMRRLGQVGAGVSVSLGQRRSAVMQDRRMMSFVRLWDARWRVRENMSVLFMRKFGGSKLWLLMAWYSRERFRVLRLVGRAGIWFMRAFVGLVSRGVCLY
jgi:hypothetical protein